MTGISRRRFASLAVATSIVPAAGCASMIDDQEVTCEGDCQLVEGTSVDAHSGWGPYTDITVRFRERFTGTLFFDAEHRDETRFVEEIQVEDIRAETFEFDKYASRITMEVSHEQGDADA